MAERKFTDLHVGYAKAWTDFRITDTEMYVQHFEDVTDIIQVNKFLQSHTPQDLTNYKTGWRWVARIPLSVDADLARRGIYKDKKAFNRWKNDPDNAVWALCRDKRTARTPSGIEVITKKGTET